MMKIAYRSLALPLRGSAHEVSAACDGFSRAELARHQLALEDRAGIRHDVDEVRERPDFGLFGYDLLRQRIRRAYFGVHDAALRAALIRTAAELERVDRFEASRALCRARAELAQAQSREQRVPVLLAALVPLACVGAGGLLFDLAGQAAGAIAGFACGAMLLRRRRGAGRHAIARSESRLAEAEAYARQVWAHPALFACSECDLGVESVEFGRQSAVANRLQRGGFGTAPRSAPTAQPISPSRT